MRHHSRPLPIIAFALVFGLGAPALAQDEAEIAPPAASLVPGDTIEVGGEVGGFEGVRQINMAAGNANQQANIASVASGETAVNTAIVAQVGETASAVPGRRYDARITGDAFAGSHGLTAVNIAAGSDNQQVNLAMITTGLEGRVASTAVLSQTRASSEPLGINDASVQPEHTARIDPGAFRDSSGIVQVSLIGGTGNASANVAVLSMEAGTN
ncbi:MAG: hypothetical protein WBA51_13725 [Erythrobacter sp.]